MTKQKIKFYDIPDHIKQLEFDGDKTDLRLHYDSHMHWYEKDEKEYEKIEKHIQDFEIKRDQYIVYVGCDVSGHDYWINQQEEGNYVMVTVAFENEEVEIDIDQLKDDVDSAYCEFECYESYAPLNED